MKFYSTRNRQHLVDFEEAVFQSLPADGGLYMPEEIPRLDPGFLSRLSAHSFQEIALETAAALIGKAVPRGVLREIVEGAVDFPAPLVQVGDARVMELFHGPSMAFKDFGARFMSRIMAYFLEKNHRELDILVATSGDTGGAVALGFYQVPHIRVTILYPSGKVSPIQEKQLTSLGGNIRALEVKGTFDDCQRLVKEAFLDRELNQRLQLSSANSINISRLIPQAFYYLNAVAQLQREEDHRPALFSVPSGNFGNLTAGLIARRMGMPCAGFVAATNINDEVPAYLSTGKFEPRPSAHTLSNAMDVGNPSNFQRMMDLFSHRVEDMRAVITGYAFTDEETTGAIRTVFDREGYMMCPHTAVAWLGLKRALLEHTGAAISPIFLSTAHPSKFEDVYEPAIREQLTYPEQVSRLRDTPKKSIVIPDDFDALKQVL